MKENVRLIDANDVIKALGTDTKVRRVFCEYIDKYPTAYDVEKVVEQLEKELSNVVFEKATQEVNESFFDGMAYAYGRSIDIIRAGGKE